MGDFAAAPRAAGRGQGRSEIVPAHNREINFSIRLFSIDWASEFPDIE
jgi:hypothetical protein